jgi:TadE-like protein
MKNLYCIENKVVGQTFTEFIIIFPVLLLMLSSVIFFARLLVLKQRTVVAVRYVAWYAGRHGGNEPSAEILKGLFFNQNSRIGISHPDPSIGFADNSLGDLGDVLGEAAGINGTAIDVTGYNYPFSSKIAHTGAQHFMFMDTWKESGSTGKILKYGLWAIAVGKAFKGSSTSIDLENPSITGK